MVKVLLNMFIYWYRYRYTGVLERILQVEAKGDGEIGDTTGSSLWFKHIYPILRYSRGCPEMQTEHMGKTLQSLTAPADRQRGATREKTPRPEGSSHQSKGTKESSE